MKKILVVSVAIAALTGCATNGAVNNHSKNVTTRTKSYNPRDLASTKTVVVNANQDQSADYPTLAQLCLASGASQSVLSFATAVISPAEVMTIGLQCNVNHLGKNKNAVTFSISAVRDIISGPDEYKVSEFPSDVYFVRNQNEVTIVVRTSTQSSYVADYYLNLNSMGQPINTKDNFTGVASADMSKSGFYQVQDQDEALKTCILEQDDVAGCTTNVTSGSNGALQVGSQLYSSVTIPFGWLMNKSPTNTDLDMKAGRVNFTQSMAELAAVIKANYKTQAADVQSVIADAKKAISSANQ